MRAVVYGRLIVERTWEYRAEESFKTVCPRSAVLKLPYEKQQVLSLVSFDHLYWKNVICISEGPSAKLKKFPRRRTVL